MYRAFECMGCSAAFYHVPVLRIGPGDRIAQHEDQPDFGKQRLDAYRRDRRKEIRCRILTHERQLSKGRKPVGIAVQEVCVLGPVVIVDQATVLVKEEIRMRDRIVRVEIVDLVFGQADLGVLIEDEMQRRRTAFRRTADNEIRKSVRHDTQSLCTKPRPIEAAARGQAAYSGNECI